MRPQNQSKSLYKQMKSFFAAVILSILAQSTFAFAPYNEREDISISAKATPEELVIDVAGDVQGVVNLSIFSQMGEVVMTKELKAGSNSVSVKFLRSGSYIAVVRENDTFKQKLEFQVN